MENGKTIEKVTVSKNTFQKLNADSYFLHVLMAVGVENWEGYEEARRMFEEDYPS